MMNTVAAHAQTALKLGTCCAIMREAASRKRNRLTSCSRSYVEASAGFPVLLPLPASQQIAASPLSLEPGLKSFHCT